MPIEGISATTPVREISPYDKSAAQERQQKNREEQTQSTSFTPQAANANQPSTQTEPAMTADEAIGSSVLPPASAPVQNEEAQNNQYARQDLYPQEPMGKEQLPNVDANA
jgi:hypothetical protein